MVCLNHQLAQTPTGGDVCGEVLRVYMHQDIATAILSSCYHTPAHSD